MASSSSYRRASFSVSTKGEHLKSKVPLLDFSQLRRQTAGDPVLLEEILALFLCQSEEWLANPASHESTFPKSCMTFRIGTCDETKEWVNEPIHPKRNGLEGDLAMAAHRLAGAARAIGALRLAETAKKLENALSQAGASSSCNAEETLAALRASLVETRAILHFLLAGEAAK